MAHQPYPRSGEQRQGMSTLAKVLLIGGGVIATMVLVLIVVLVWAAGRIVEEFPEIMEAVEEVGEQVEAEFEVAKVTAVGAIRSDINAAVVAVLDAMVAREEGISVEAGEEGSGVAFRINLPGETQRMEMDFVSVGEILDRVASGETRLADVAAEAADVDAADVDGLPEWARIYPGASRNAAFHFDLEEFSLGGAVFIADAGAAEVLDWYEEEGADLPDAMSFSTNRSTGGDPDNRRDGHISLISGGRRLSVLAVEDSDGYSLFVVLYRDNADASPLDSDSR